MLEQEQTVTHLQDEDSQDLEQEQPHILGFRFGDYYPSAQLTNRDIERWRIIKSNGNPITADGIFGVLGVESRNVSSPVETLPYMGIHAAQEALGSWTDVDVVLFSTSRPNGVHNAKTVADELGLRPSTVLDIHVACSGFVLGINYLASFADEFTGQKVAFITANDYQKMVAKGEDMAMDPSMAAGIFSDGAHAMVFEFGKDLQVDANNNLTSEVTDEAYNLIGMPVYESSAVPPYVFTGTSQSEKFRQHGPKVLSYVKTHVPGLVRKVAENAKYNPTDTLVLSHQPSKPAMERLARELSEFKDLPFDYQEGNFGSGSIPKLFAKLMKEGKIINGDQVIFAGFGAGMHVEIAAARIG